MRYRQLIILLALSVLVTVTACAGSAFEYFASMPESVLPLWSRNTRLDMIDYFRGGLPTPSGNVFEGTSRIVEADAGAVTIQVSRDATVQIAVVAAGKDTVLTVIETVLTPFADSSVTFYDKEWRRLGGQPLLPSASDFLPADKRGKVKDLPEIVFEKAEYDSGTGEFVFVNTTPGYYTEYDRPEGLSQMRHSIRGRLDKGTFRILP